MEKQSSGGRQRERWRMSSAERSIQIEKRSMYRLRRQATAGALAASCRRARKRCNRRPEAKQCRSRDSRNAEQSDDSSRIFRRRARCCFASTPRREEESHATACGDYKQKIIHEQTNAATESGIRKGRNSRSHCALWVGSSDSPKRGTCRRTASRADRTCW